jgi:hypothetical protein
MAAAVVAPVDFSGGIGWQQYRSSVSAPPATDPSENVSTVEEKKHALTYMFTHSLVRCPGMESAASTPAAFL